MSNRFVRGAAALAATLLSLACAGAARAQAPGGADTLHVLRTGIPPDTLRFTPLPEDTMAQGAPGAKSAPAAHRGSVDQWLQAPFGDGLLSDLDAWRARLHAGYQLDGIISYNRVDRLRTGTNFQAGPVYGRLPRVGARLEVAWDRERVLYGLQIEQPIDEDGRYFVGASAVRRTDHSDLQHIGDIENSLALLFGRQDYRDYFEREGAGGYVQARVARFSTVSLHLRADDWRSLALDRGTRSWFHTDRPLRANAPIDEGRSRVVTLRFERLAHRTALTRAGFYHWAEFERAGAGLGGDFDYTRALLDLRSVLRLSPAATLSVRGVAGSSLAGTLPRQREFTAGGVDGLRAHMFSQFRGNQMALAQAEYTIGLWRVSSQMFQGGLHAILFVDTGRAWSSANRWNVFDQELEADGGVGLSTSEDNVRVYVARDLKESHADFVVSLRLQRPF